MKKFFAILILLVSVVSLWVGGKFFLHLYHYLLLSQMAPAIVNEWKVEEIQSGNFVIRASFAFQVDGQMFYQNFTFPEPVCQNKYLAHSLIKKWKKEVWQVWYNPKHPKIASLQRQFPIKTGIYFALSVGIFLYFLWLKIYIQRIGAIDK